jgi:DNA-binding response OmpR family regulator
VKRPVGLIELLDKIYAAIERRQRSALPLPSAVITSGLLTLDTVQRAATWAGEPLNLTANEFRVLTQLVSNPGRVYTPVDLYASFGGERLPHHVARNLIKQYIFKLRAKLEQKGKYPLQIVAVRGQGYKWVDAESDSA